MRANSYQTRAALGITRVGDNNGSVRTISMAGFSAYSPIVKDASTPTGYRWCDVGFYEDDSRWPDKETGYRAYCDCMYPPEVAPDANTSCKKFNRVPGFGIAIAPWSFLAKAVSQEQIDAGVKLLEKGGEALLKKITEPGTTPVPDTGTTPVPDTGTTPVPGGGTGGGNPLLRDPGVRVRLFGPAEKKEIPTGLILGGAAVAVAAIFLLRKK
jgi:hypothetical protein